MYVYVCVRSYVSILKIKNNIIIQVKYLHTITSMPDAGKPVKIINNNKNQRKKRNYSNKKRKTHTSTSSLT